MTRRTIDDRRRARRFPIERVMRYEMIGRGPKGQSGQGKTINISSSGVLFLSDLHMSPGRYVEVAISWPARLDAFVDLQLVARGKIVRCDRGTTAVKFDRYEFRTCARNSFCSLDVPPGEAVSADIAT